MKRILLIEDNFEMRENISEILELANYAVTAVENGKLGVRSAQGEFFDLIISDIMMPELDGFGVLHILSQNSHTANIPFIFLSAKADKSNIRKGMGMGADDYLTKPFTESELLNTVSMRLKKNQNIKEEYEKLSKQTKQHSSAGLVELKELIKDTEVSLYDKKQCIYREKKHPNYLFYLQKGLVKTFKTNHYGKEYITAIYRVGEYLGYQALLENAVYNDSAMVLEDAEVVMIPKNNFFAILDSSQSVTRKFIKILASEITQKENLLLQLAYDSVRMRVANALLVLNNNRDSNTAIHISREDLANIVGTAQETVIRSLSDFKHEKIIEIKSKNIFIKDLTKLKYIASSF